MSGFIYLLVMFLGVVVVSDWVVCYLCEVSGVVLINISLWLFFVFYCWF